LFLESIAVSRQENADPAATVRYRHQTILKCWPRIIMLRLRAVL